MGTIVFCFFHESYFVIFFFDDSFCIKNLKSYLRELPILYVSQLLFFQFERKKYIIILYDFEKIYIIYLLYKKNDRKEVLQIHENLI